LRQRLLVSSFVNRDEVRSGRPAIVSLVGDVHLQNAKHYRNAFRKESEEAVKLSFAQILFELGLFEGGVDAVEFDGGLFLEEHVVEGPVIEEKFPKIGGDVVVVVRLDPLASGVDVEAEDHLFVSNFENDFVEQIANHLGFVFEQTLLLLVEFRANHCDNDDFVDIGTCAFGFPDPQKAHDLSIKVALQRLLGFTGSFDSVGPQLG